MQVRLVKLWVHLSVKIVTSGCNKWIEFVAYFDSNDQIPHQKCSVLLKIREVAAIRTSIMSPPYFAFKGCQHGGHWFHFQSPDLSPIRPLSIAIRQQAPSSATGCSAPVPEALLGGSEPELWDPFLVYVVLLRS